MMMLNRKKFENAVIFICNQHKRRIHVKRVEKLLFFADKLAFKTLAHTITGVPYLRKEDGPVPKNFEGLLADMEQKELVSLYGKDDSLVIMSKTGTDFSCFEKAELDAICATLAMNKKYSTKNLAKRSRDLAWSAFDDGEKIPFEAYLSEPRQPCRTIPCIRKRIEQEEAKYAAPVMSC